MWPLIRQISESSDVKQLAEPRKLTPLEMDEIQKKIRRGAKDVDQQWASAIELTEKAYEHLGQVVPLSPANADAWECYQANIEHAVSMLAKYRGLDDQTWRISAAPDEP